MKRLGVWGILALLGGCIVVVDDHKHQPPPHQETTVVYVAPPPPPQPPPPPPPLPPEPPEPPPPPPPALSVEVTVGYGYQPAWEDTRVVVYREYFGCGLVTYAYMGRIQAQHSQPAEG